MNTEPANGGTLMIAPFPPPRVGNAISSKALADALERQGLEIVRADVGTGEVRMSRLKITYHLTRTGRYLAAANQLLRVRPRSTIIALSGGLGLIYEIGLLAIARFIRCQVFLQHHTYHYMNRKSVLLAVLVRAFPTAEHLVLCDRMGDGLKAKYGAKNVQRLSLGYTLFADRVTSTGSLRDESSDGSFTIGYVGRLMPSKGAAIALEVVSKVAQAGISARLVVAGAAETRSEIDIQTRMESDPFTQYLGVLGREDLLDRVYSSIDMLVFPSTYRYESYGLVVLEALNAGVPVVALPVGCLDKSFLGDGGKLVANAADFVDSASLFALELAGDAQARLAYGRGAKRAGDRELRKAEADLLLLSRKLDVRSDDGS